LQAYRGQDDGMEHFGGTANVRYFVVTEGGDDGVDWDFGYSGKIQYGLVWHGEGFGEDFGIEAANNPDGFDLEPRANPIVSNFTFMGNGNGDAGILLKEGSGGRIFNSIVYQFADGCIEMANSPATYDAAGSPSAPNTDTTSFNGMIVMCDDNFLTADGAPFTVANFYNSNQFLNNLTTNPRLDGMMPQSNSPALGNGVFVDDAWIEQTTYSGGFDGANNWMEGWTHCPMGCN
jgi:hypothetical protein